MKKITKQLRQEIEEKIYQVMLALDPSKENFDKYKSILASMDDKQFMAFASKQLPFRYYHKPWVTETSIQNTIDALDLLDQKLFQEVNLPYLYVNKEGKPVKSLPAMIIYDSKKKMQQFITHKNGISVETKDRDMKSGRLNAADKNGTTSDRENESMAILGLENCMKELDEPRADNMPAKNEMNNKITQMGMFSLEDVNIENKGSMSKNLLSTYLIGANIMSNIINEDYMTPYTLANKSKKIEIKK